MDNAIEKRLAYRTDWYFRHWGMQEPLDHRVIAIDCGEHRFHFIQLFKQRFLRARGDATLDGAPVHVENSDFESHPIHRRKEHGARPRQGIFGPQSAETPEEILLAEIRDLVLPLRQRTARQVYGAFPHISQRLRGVLREYV